MPKVLRQKKNMGRTVDHVKLLLQWQTPWQKRGNHGSQSGYLTAMITLVPVHIFWCFDFAIQPSQIFLLERGKPQLPALAGS